MIINNGGAARPRKVLQKNSVYQLANLLTPGEKRRFLIFLESAYFNTEPRMLVLYKLLNQNPPPDREECWQQMEGDIPYNDARMRQWLTRFFSLLRRFIVLRSFESQPNLSSPVWLNELLDRRASNIFQKEWNSSRKELENAGLRNGSYFLHRFQLEYLNELEQSRSPSRSQRVSGVGHMKDLLQAYCDFTEAHLECLEWSMNRAKGKKATQSRPLQTPPNLFRLLSDLLSEPSYDPKDTFFTQFVAHSKRYSQEERYDLFTGYQNKLVLNLNHSNAEVVMEKIFALYLYAIEESIIVFEGIIAPHYFKNIVEAGLMLGKGAEVEKFLDQYEECLPQGVKGFISAYCRARLHFFHKNYGQTLSILNRTQFPDPMISLNARLLRLKTCYELGEISLLESGIKSLAQYLRETDKIPHDSRRKFSNRLKFLRRIYESPKPAKMQALKEEIVKFEVPIEAKWFLEKIDGISKKGGR